jgi:hypothetical protein
MGRAARGGMSSVSPRARTRSRHAARWVARRSPQHLGRLYVYLDTRDTNRDEVRDNSYDMLVARLENENEFLRRELERKDTILLNMTEAMKALNPPAREPSENAPESPESPGPSDTPTEKTPKGRMAKLRPHSAAGGSSGGSRPKFSECTSVLLVTSWLYAYQRREIARTEGRTRLLLAGVGAG